MRHVPRIYAPDLAPLAPLTLRGEAAKHLTGVMRLRPGDEFLAFPGNGHEWRATVSSISRDSVLATVGGLVRQEPPLPVILETWIGVVRAARLDDAIEKCVEAGADIIRPVICEFSQRGEDASKMKLERWRRIAVQAAEQSGRLFVPVVEPPRPLRPVLEQFRGALVFGDGNGSPAHRLVELLPSSGSLAWVVGPEGGLSEAEMALLKTQGGLPLSLGPYIFRTETAAVAGTAALRSATALP